MSKLFPRNRVYLVRGKADRLSKPDQGRGWLAALAVLSNSGLGGVRGLNCRSSACEKPSRGESTPPEEAAKPLCGEKKRNP